MKCQPIFAAAILILGLVNPLRGADPVLLGKYPATGSSPNRFLGVDHDGTDLYSVTFGAWDGNGALRRMTGTAPPVQDDASEEYSYARKVEVYNRNAFVLYYRGTGNPRWGLRAFDAGTLEKLDDGNYYGLWDEARGLHVDGGYAYVAGEFGLSIIDVRNPVEVLGDPNTGLRTVGTATSVTDGYDVDVADGVAYVVDGTGGLKMIDVSPPGGALPLVGSWSPGAGKTVRGIKFVDGPSGPYVVLVGNGLWIVDVNDPAAPVLLGSLDEDAERVDVANGFAYVAGYYGMRIYKLNNLTDVAFEGRYSTESQGEDIKVVGQTIYLADISGLYALRHGEPPSASIEVSMAALNIDGIADFEDRECPFSPVEDTEVLEGQRDIFDPNNPCGLVADGATPLIFPITGFDLNGPVDVDLEFETNSGAIAGGIVSKARILTRFMDDEYWISMNPGSSARLTQDDPVAFVSISAIDASELQLDPGESAVQLILRASAPAAGIDPVEFPFSIRRPPLALMQVPEVSASFPSWSVARIDQFKAARGDDFVRSFDAKAPSPDYGINAWLSNLRTHWAVTRVDAACDLLSIPFVLDGCQEYPRILAPRPLDPGARLDYVNESNRYCGWFRRIVTVGGNHRGSRLQPYLKAFGERARAAGGGLEVRYLPVRLQKNNPFYDYIEDDNASLSRFFNPVDDFYTNGMELSDFAYEAKFHHIATKIGPDDLNSASAFVFVGLDDPLRRAIVIPNGTDGVLDLDSAIVGFDRPHTVVQGSISALPGQWWGTTESIYDSPAVAQHVLDALAAPPNSPTYRFDFFAPGDARDLTKFDPSLLVLSSPLSTTPLDAIRQEGEDAVAGIVDILESPQQGSPRDNKAAVLYEIDPPTGLEPAGPVTWLVETYGPSGPTEDGASATPVPGEPLKAEIDIQPGTVGDTVVYASYPTATGQIVLASPRLVGRTEPAGTTMTGITVFPGDGELTLGDSFEIGLFTDYDDGTRLLRWVTAAEISVTSSTPAAVDVSNKLNWLAAGEGSSTVTVQYMGFSADSEITVADPYPPQTFAEWRADQFTTEELADPEVSGAGIDLEGDGLDLAFEYVTGGSPRSADEPAIRLWGAEVGGEPTPALLLRLSRTLAGEVTVQRSEDLAGWEDWFVYDPAAPDLESAPVAEVSDGGRWRYLTLHDEPISPVAESAYYRFRIGVPGGSGGEITGTTELVFDLGGAPLAGYGDRVDALVMGGYSYGGEPDFTPNVEASHYNQVRTWNSGYGDLQNVIFSDLGTLELLLVADIGYRAVLESFDMAAYGSSFAADPTLQLVSVFDGAGSALFSEQDAVISEKTRTTFEMPSGVEAETLSIQFDATNLAANLRDEIGFDNLRFGQRPVLDLGNSTLLIFEVDGLGDGATLPAGYGDAVTAATMGTFSYRGTGSFTPGISSEFGPAGADPSLWDGSFGSLQHVLYNENEHQDTFEITLIADPGFDVRLYGFDLAADNTRFTADPIVDSVAVLDGGGGELYSAASVTVSETYLTRIDLSAAPPQAGAVTIRIDATSLGSLSEFIGIDNIRYEQVPDN